MPNYFRRIKPLRSAYWSWLRLTHIIRSLRSPFIRFVPAGHFYSPLPDLAAIDLRKAELFLTDVETIAGVDLQVDQQLSLLTELSGFADGFPYGPTQAVGLRYQPDNLFFGITDALILFTLLRARRPQRVIEVGSGYTSALMLDTAERFLSHPVQFTFIEPYPQRLYALLSPDDRQRCQVIEQPVQSAPLALFEALESGDILFIDSSHVAKVGSDVLRIFFDILPRLKPGVLVHFHDITWPFVYPYEHLQQGIAWNEIFVLRAFLQYNRVFKIRYYSAYIEHMRAEAFAAAFPGALQDPGCSSLWLERQASDYS